MHTGWAMAHSVIFFAHPVTFDICIRPTHLVKLYLFVDSEIIIPVMDIDRLVKMAFILVPLLEMKLIKALKKSSPLSSLNPIKMHCQKLYE